MTQTPPPPPMSYAPPQPRPVNGWAIASLVCGIVGCFLITPFAAVVTGIIGLGKSRRLGGRGLAITGIILGVLWIVGFLGLGGVSYFGGKYVIGQAKQKTVDTINALAADDFTQAKAVARLSDADAAELSQKFKAYGKCTGITVDGFNTSASTGQGRSITITGKLTFDTAGSKAFSSVATVDQSGLKIDALRVD